MFNNTKKIKDLFLNRDDIFVDQYPKKDGSAGYGLVCSRGKPWECDYHSGKCGTECENFLPVAIDDTVIEAHLNGTRTIGIYAAHEGKAKWVAVDFDSNDGDLTDVASKASRLYEAFSSMGITPYVEISGSKGLHVWVFFKEPIEANLAKKLAELGLAKAGITDRPEIFPKSADSNKVGSLIKLPFGKHLATGTRCNFIDVTTSRPFKDQMKFLHTIETVELQRAIDLVGGIPETKTVPVETSPKSNYSTALKADESLPCFAEMMKGVLAGSRNQVTYTLAKHFKRRDVGEDATVDILIDWNRNNDPPLDEAEVRTAVESAYTGPNSGFDCENDLIKPFCEDSCPLLLKKEGVEVVPVVDLATLHKKSQELYGNNGDVLEIVLATSISHLIFKGNLVWVLLVGVPSSSKTEMIRLLRYSELAYNIDSMSEFAFVSGYVGANGDKSQDLLPQLDGKCFVFKDFTSLFNQRAEVLRKLLGDLVNIHDGSFSRHTPTTGTISYDSRFSHIAAITPLSLREHQKRMNILGARYLYYIIPDMPVSDESLDRVWLPGRKSKTDEFRKLCSAFIDNLADNIPTVQEEDKEAKEYLIRLARLLAQSRGVPGQTEVPFRVLEQLIALGRSIAAIHGRDKVTPHELELLRRVVLNSIPADRAKVLEVFQSDESMTYQEVSPKIAKRDENARVLLEGLRSVGILIRREEKQKSGQMANVYRLEDKFKDIIISPLIDMDHANVS